MAGVGPMWAPARTEIGVLRVQESRNPIRTLWCPQLGGNSEPPAATCRDCDVRRGREKVQMGRPEVGGGWGTRRSPSLRGPGKLIWVVRF